VTASAWAKWLLVLGSAAVSYMPASIVRAQQAPRGYLDGADCTSVRGWTQDLDVPDAPIDVHIYFGAPAGTPGAIVVVAHADVHRDDLCAAIGSCAHGFIVPVPTVVRDGVARGTYAYGIDAMGGTNPLLAGSPIEIRCDLGAVAAPGASIKRKVPDTTAFAAWRFATTDVAMVPTTLLSGLTLGPALGTAPVLVSQGGAGVGIIDGTTVRPISAAAMTAWRFSTSEVQPRTAAELGEYVVGVAWRESPVLAQVSGAPEIYALDDPPALWAEIVEHTVPARARPGETVDASITFENRGSIAWDAGAVRLVTTEPVGRESAVCDPSWTSCAEPFALEPAVAPGARAAGVLRMRIPLVGDGTDLRECFGVRYRGHSFADASQGGPADDALCFMIRVSGEPAGDDLAVSSGCAVRPWGGRTSSAIVVGAVAVALFGARRRKRRA